LEVGWDRNLERTSERNRGIECEDGGDVNGAKVKDNGGVLLEKRAPFIQCRVRRIMTSNTKVRGGEISDIVLSCTSAEVGMAIERSDKDIFDLVGVWGGAINRKRAVRSWAIGTIPVGTVRVFARGLKGSNIF
jgi:hypothetical protein